MSQRFSIMDVAYLILAEMEARKPLTRDMEIEVSRRDIEQWFLERCAVCNRNVARCGRLHVDFSEWCAERGKPVIPSRRSFEDALVMLGFDVDVEEGWCLGAILNENLSVLEPDLGYGVSGKPYGNTAVEQ